VAAVDTTPDEPPMEKGWLRGEARASIHSFKNNLNTMHGQPRLSRGWIIKIGDDERVGGLKSDD